MRSFWAIFGTTWLLLAAIPVHAQALRVEAGEHAAFTRIVVPWPNSGRWDARLAEGQVSLSLEGHTGGFDVARVFQRIQRSRIAAVSQNEDALTILMNCECDVAAFSNGKGYVVIDVADAGRTVVPPLEMVRAPVVPAPSISATPTPMPVPMPWMAEQLRARSESEGSEPEKDEPAPVFHATPLEPDLPSTAQLDILNELQRRLAQEVGSATTRGVLEPAQEGLALTDLLEDAQQPAKKAEQPEEPYKVKPSQNLRITTSRDVPQKPGHHDALEISSGIVCPANEVAALENWGDEREFAVQISEHRSLLYGEFDRLDAEAAMDLARTYLYFGFGAEAAQLLRLKKDPHASDPIFAGIAEILERGHTDPSHALTAFADCDSSIALWAVLSMKKIPSGTLVNKAATLRALNKLPLHLRKFLAPALSERFLEFGDPKGAATALRSIERSPEQMEPEGTLAQASLALENGEDEQAVTKFEEVIGTNAAPSPNALLALVSEQLAKDQPISHETALLVEAYAYELQENDLGPELRRIHVLSLTRSGQYDEAFQALSMLRAEGGSLSMDVGSQVITELTASASDVVFLDHIFQQTDHALDSLDAPAKMAVSKRLLGLGFPGPAQRVLAFVPDRPVDPERQILAARIALGLEQTNQAVAVLIGIEGAEADRLRAEAALKSGATSEAAAFFAKADDAEAATRTAWLAEDWASLTPEETPVFGPMATLATTATEVALEAEGMLSRTSAAVEESASARETIRALLNAPDVLLPSDDQAVADTQ